MMYALDPSDEQIYNDIRENKLGSGDGIPFPNESVDIICCAQTAQQFDQKALYKEDNSVEGHCHNSYDHFSD